MNCTVGCYNTIFNFKATKRVICKTIWYFSIIAFQISPLLL